MSGKSVFYTLCVLILTVVTASAEGVKKSFACQGSNLEMTCNKGEIIYIHEASFGPVSKSVCAQNYSPKQGACVPKDISNIVKSKCSGEKICSITASNKFFGNPCPHMFKYAEVKYSCKRGLQSNLFWWG